MLCRFLFVPQSPQVWNKATSGRCIIPGFTSLFVSLSPQVWHKAILRRCIIPSLTSLFVSLSPQVWHKATSGRCIIPSFTSLFVPQSPQVWHKATLRRCIISGFTSLFFHESGSRPSRSNALSQSFFTSFNGCLSVRHHVKTTCNMAFFSLSTLSVRRKARALIDEKFSCFL